MTQPAPQPSSPAPQPLSTVELQRKILAEVIGTCLLVATVVGSGIMAEKLAGGNVAVALLANTLATAAVLLTLIAVLGPVSGAHFNPWVTLAAFWHRDLSGRVALGYVAAQMLGGVAGTALANAMFDLAIITPSTHVRTGFGQWLGEFVATFGLLVVIRGIVRNRPSAAPWAIAGWITAAYWFTSSTSFANVAVTFARAWSDTFAGIRLVDVPGFAVAQALGLVAGIGVGKKLWP
jgi:glycerol uptake facilitator-like aquaporin